MLKRRKQSRQGREENRRREQAPPSSGLFAASPEVARILVLLSIIFGEALDGGVLLFGKKERRQKREMNCQYFVLFDGTVGNLEQKAGQ